MELEINIWPVNQKAFSVGLADIQIDELRLDAFYRHYCNRVIWPSLHGYPADFGAAPDSWDAYRATNHALATAANDQVRHVERIIVRDYPLMLVPGFLREAGSTAEIRFVCSSPFDAEFINVPNAKELITGMVSADVVVMPSDSARDAFVEAAAAHDVSLGDTVIEVEPRTLFVDPVVSPLGISEIQQEETRLKRAHDRILLAVDRLTHDRAIAQRLTAFESLLDERDPNIGQPTLLQIAATSSRENVDTDLQEFLESISLRINEKHGTSSWKPVQILFNTVGLNTLIALYRAANVLVATRFSPGPYSVVDEFLHCLPNKAGAFIVAPSARQQYPGAIIADPHRPADIAHGMRRALALIGRGHEIDAISNCA